MGVHEPRILARILEGLIKQTRQWTTVANQTLKECEYVQEHAREQAERAYYNASLTYSQAENDRHSVSLKRNDVGIMLAKTVEAVNESHKLHDEVDDALEQAEKTLSHWQYKLREALEWLARAQAWLDRALTALADAQSELWSAETSLRVAQANLQACRNSYRTDRNGNRIPNNCSSEASAVQYAQARVAEARRKVNAAQEEVNRARAEVARAQARVELCRKAVAYARQAVEYAETAGEFAEQALNFADRSRENAEAAERSIQKALNTAEEQLKLAESMTLEARHAQHAEEDARIHLQRAADNLDSAYHLSVRLMQELGYKIDHLFEFDRPIL